jgi:hypothetical protein
MLANRCKCATYQTGLQELDSKPQHVDMQQFLANVLIDLMSLSGAKCQRKDTVHHSSHSASTLPEMMLSWTSFTSMLQYLYILAERIQ